MKATCENGRRPGPTIFLEPFCVTMIMGVGGLARLCLRILSTQAASECKDLVCVVPYYCGGDHVLTCNVIIAVLVG